MLRTTKRHFLRCYECDVAKSCLNKFFLFGITRRSAAWGDGVKIRKTFAASFLGGWRGTPVHTRRCGVEWHSERATAACSSMASAFSPRSRTASTRGTRWAYRATASPLNASWRRSRSTVRSGARCLETIASTSARTSSTRWAISRSLRTARVACEDSRRRDLACRSRSFSSVRVTLGIEVGQACMK